MIINGVAIAKNVLARARAESLLLGRKPKVIAIVANDTSASASYLAIKQKRALEAGCILEVFRVPESSTTESLVILTASLDADAILVQLPLPEKIDRDTVCNAIPLSKDVDVLSAFARDAFSQGTKEVLLPPVVGAIKETFETHTISVRNKNTVIIGDGFLVGAPVSVWLKHNGAPVTTLIRGDSLESLKHADIIVSGAGTPHFIKPEMIREGVTLIDAGTSELNGEIVGDADPLCADKCAFFTPVPGGIGPIAVAKLFANAVSLAKNATKT